MKLLSLLSLTCLSLPAFAQAFPPVSLAPEVAKRLGLTAEPLAKHVVADAVVATAQTAIDPTRTHVVTSFFSGQIDRDPVQLGDRVTVGQELARLKSREVAEVISNYLKDDGRFQSAELIYQREKELRAKKLTTEDDFLAAQTAWQEATAARKASLQTALLAVSRGELQALSRSSEVTGLTAISLTAPRDGIIIEKSKYSGQSVDTNEELFKIADTSQLNVEMQVPLTASALLQKGDTLNFQTVVGTTRSGKVTITMINPMVNRASLTLPVLAKLDNSKGEWRAGLPINVSVIDPRAEKVPAVPVAAIVQIEGQPHVFQSGDAGRYQPIAITLGRESQNFAEITSGLVEGTNIVTGGASILLAAWEEAAAE